jgi:hypothetical protein
LPGQKHPGLGILKEVFGWLVVVGEVLDLDGIYYVPSSYHVAIQSRRRVRFLEPVHEAWMQALDELFAGSSLAEASNIIADDRVVDETTGYRLKWKGYPMVLPVSDRLKERVTGAVYEERVAEVFSQLKLAITEPVG